MTQRMPVSPASEFVQTPQGLTPGPKWRGMDKLRLILLILTVLAAGQFIWRGPVRAVQAEGSTDLAAIYGPARAWLHGANPYDPAQVAGALRDGQYAGSALDRRAPRTGVYPPATYVCMAPLAVMDWPAAKRTWMLVNLAAVALLLQQLIALMHLVNGPGSEGKALMRKAPQIPLSTLYLTLGVLLLAPLHTTVFLGQTAIVTVVVTIASFSASLRGRPVLAGVLAGVAIAFKPQLGVVAVAYLLTRFRWRSACIALFTAALIVLLGVGQLYANAPQWLDDLRANMDYFSHNDAGNMARDGRFTHQWLSIQALLHLLIDNRASVNVLAVTLGAACTLYAMGNMTARSGPRRELLFISVLSVACLLSAPNQRFYCATLLALPLVIVLASLFGTRGMPGIVPRGQRHFVVDWVSLGAIAVFAVPGAAFLFVVAQAYLPAAVNENLLWKAVFLLHGTWALCVLLGCLLWQGSFEDGGRIAWRGVEGKVVP